MIRIAIIAFSICLMITEFVLGQTTSITYFTKDFEVSNTVLLQLVDLNGDALKQKYVYRVKLATLATGTPNGAEYLVWHETNNSLWKIRYVAKSGNISNHPLLVVENNIVKVKTNHSSIYKVRAIVESLHADVPAVRPFVFGASYQWQRSGTDLSFSDGNVGIGTSDPEARLAVNGSILATEVKVKNDISVPDYVFEEGYHLPALDEIEAYVKEHKHLPEIPSATDVKKDGLNLAEMNLLLLKKVEELTLHLIEKDKQIQDLHTKFGEHQKEIQVIKSIIN